MPKNIKHKMLIEAKRIANIEFKEEILKHEDGEEILSPSVVKNLYISDFLEDNPDFDESEFRKMIKTFELRNKEDYTPEDD